MLGILGTVTSVIAVVHLAMVIVLARWPHAGLASTLLIASGAACGSCAVYARLFPAHMTAAIAGAAVAVAAAGGYARMSRWLHPVGAGVWSSWLLLRVVLLGWGAVFLYHLNVSPMTSTLLWMAAIPSALTLPSMVVKAREEWETLLRRRGRRSVRPPIHPRSGGMPRVSVQVPCHAEPPEIVIGTLEHLAKLDYPDFEVLVIDNNTTDPGLWRPVAAYCEQLGERFRFLHIEGIKGAKAGALNWALPYTSPQAELIAVVDADYQVRPEWLRDTVGYFADPSLGFVQCPHAYRDYSGSPLGRLANWEYAGFFVTGMVTLDERRAGITVGTMSLIRRAALEEVGGWAEWCLTEDSELAIRMHAAGYQSIYLNEPYGHGLIPETFDGYRRQRYRWTFGPVQEFQRHWRLFLPGRLATPSALTGQQKLHHANHGLANISDAVNALCILPTVGAVASVMAHHERVPMLGGLWVAAGCLLASGLLLPWITYRRLLRATPRQTLGGMLATVALSYIKTIASLRAAVRRPAQWQRTDKFRQRRRNLRVLAQVSSETVLGLAGLLVSAAIIALTRGGFVTAMAIGLALQCVPFLAAPAVALVADRGLAREAPHVSVAMKKHPQLDRASSPVMAS